MKKLLILGTLLGVTTVAGASEPRKVATVEGITEYALDNGLRVLLFPDDSRRRSRSTSPTSSARATRATARRAWRTCSST